MILCLRTWHRQSSSRFYFLFLIENVKEFESAILQLLRIRNAIWQYDNNFKKMFFFRSLLIRYILEKACSHPEPLENGKVDYELSSFGSKVSYECDKCFNLDGPKERVCLGNETWSGAKPVCKRKWKPLNLSFALIANIFQTYFCFIIFSLFFCFAVFMISSTLSCILVYINEQSPKVFEINFDFKIT